MIAKVKLLNGFKKYLFYKIPDNWNLNYNDITNLIIKVPIKNRLEYGIIIDILDGNEQFSFTIKDISLKIELKNHIKYNKFIEYLSYYYCIDKTLILNRIVDFLNLENKIDKSLEYKNFYIEDSKNIELTDEQNLIVKEINKQNNYKINLIHGVTGSGKTEVYKKIAEHKILNNKSVIILLPEISLAIKIENIIKEYFKSKSIDTEIYSFHSACNKSNNKLLNKSLLESKNIIIIGVHMPIFLPIDNLGLIIIDEEHDIGFQEKRYPKFNTKDIALIRAKIDNIPIVLGSATPSITTLYKAKTNNWNIFTLNKRYSGIMPNIKVVNLDNKKRTNFWISKELEESIYNALDKKQQIIIFLNRRGHSFFVKCNNCNNILECKNCSVSLTLHKEKDNELLICHYCNFTIKNRLNCLNCFSTNIIKKGIGTQQIVKILKDIYKNAIVERLDLDITKNRSKFENIVEKFENGSIDILVGTKTITKGFDFKNVSLVGIIWADINLNIPMYNIAEIVLQEIIQVSGRSGRSFNSQSNVIIQKFTNHDIFNYIIQDEYTNFYNHEIKRRKETFYPPFSRFSEIELRNKNIDILNNEIEDIFNNIKSNNNIIILGPVYPPINKIKNYFIKKIYIKSTNIHNIITIFNSINKTKYKSLISIIHNPIN